MVVGRCVASHLRMTAGCTRAELYRYGHRPRLEVAESRGVLTRSCCARCQNVGTLYRHSAPRRGIFSNVTERFSSAFLTASGRLVASPTVQALSRLTVRYRRPLVAAAPPRARAVSRLS